MTLEARQDCRNGLALFCDARRLSVQPFQLSLRSCFLVLVERHYFDAVRPVANQSQVADQTIKMDVVIH